MRKKPTSIFEKILFFTATTSTKKNGLGTLGVEKLKFTKKNLPAKNEKLSLPFPP